MADIAHIDPADGRRDDDWHLLETVGVAVVQLDVQATVVSYNRVAERLLRWTDGSRRGRSFGDLVAGLDGQDPDETVDSALAGGRAWAGRITPRGPHQDTAPALATIVPVRWPDRGPVRYLVLLLEPESVFWPLLTGVLDGWLVLHATGRVTFASDHATRLLGSPATTVGQESVLVPGHPTSEPLGAMLARHLTSPAPGRTLEFQLDRDGLSRWIEATAIRTNASGPLAGVVWRLRDVTDRVRVERKHKALSEELQRALDSRVAIEQAKGFLAGRDGIGTAEAFRRLRRHARDRNLEIHEAARQVVDGRLALDRTD